MTLDRSPALALEAVCLSEAHQLRGGETARRFTPIHTNECWVNVNGHGDHNLMHHHAGACWSGVICVKYSKSSMEG